ncbi:26S proteasome regulatory subunit N7 [Angomonas deanei]|nr:26S proteasome regulatory subunit N7 [Angomonas deanei]EPY41956.1 26S proteasome regulatory subunit N7 [Angomonas deanei]EPY43510.1 26S proteasome regulatory subunit N7 [Angomonas deanei]|eukprot:EPY38002.1 26S proteasome regulatory subunit N7 [Angomonas deanei]
MVEEMRTHHMAPYIRMIQAAMGWDDFTEAELAEMDKINAGKLEQWESKARDATDNLGDVEVRDALQGKCDLYARIGDLDNFLQANDACSVKTLAAGPRMDLCFQRVRMGIAFSDNNIAAEGLQKAQKLMLSSDWERRNRLKVYEGVYYIFVRDFKKGSELLLESINTFASGELLSFKDFVFVTIIASLPVLSRGELKKKIIDSPEVLSADLDDAYGLLTAIYTCQYDKVFTQLDAVCQHQRRIVYVSPHVNYFFREVRVLVFTQFLDSYSSVTLKSMSEAFRIPTGLLDSMLSTFIFNERITCKVDRINGSVQTYRGDATNFHYHKIIKSGDILINRIQKLSRLVDM